jgi:hypothetical protein
MPAISTSAEKPQSFASKCPTERIVEDRDTVFRLGSGRRFDYGSRHHHAGDCACQKQLHELCHYKFLLSLQEGLRSKQTSTKPVLRAGRLTARSNVRFSNRPFGVKRFQTIHQHSVDVAHGLVLLFGIGAKALPSWDSKTRRNNLWDGLAVSVTAGPSGHTISPHPSSREGHHSTAQWNSSFLLLD